MGSALDITEEEMRRIFETDFFGAVRLTRAIAPQMIERRSGLIINVASLAGLTGHLFNATYSSAKHALVGFSRSIRLELKPFNINVVSVEPGYHKTEIIRANANITDNFYDKESAMFEYNRGFLRLMMDEVVLRAAEADAVPAKIIEIMQAKKPKAHYVIGKDARIVALARWLGLAGLVDSIIYKKFPSAVRREKRLEREIRRSRKKS